MSNPLIDWEQNIIYLVEGANIKKPCKSSCKNCDCSKKKKLRKVRAKSKSSVTRKQARDSARKQR